MAKKSKGLGNDKDGQSAGGKSRVAYALAAILSLVVTATLAGYFHTEAFYNPDTEYYSFPWRATWIKAPFPGATACFRKEILLSERPRSAYVAAAVDNFYEIEVNGEHVKPFFMPSRYATWVTEQSIYTEVGYPRRRQIGWIYDLKPLLHPGLNVIAFKVESDEGAPMIALQGEIVGSNITPIISNGTWKCWPHADSQEDVSWDQAKYVDASWPNAIDTLNRVNVSVDGLPIVFTEPPKGLFIRSAQSDLGSVSFHSTLHMSSDHQDCWLRLGTMSSYDLSVNGRMLYSNAMLNRYDALPWVKRGNTDALMRIEGASHLTGQYPSNLLKRRVDVFILKNIFNAGDNDFTVTLHDGPVPELRTTKTVWIDGYAKTNGKFIPINTDLGWTAQSNGNGPVTRVVADSTVSYSDLVDSVSHLAGKFDPGLGFTHRLLAIDALLLVALSLFTVLNSFLFRKDADSIWSRIPLLAPAIVLSVAYGWQVLFANSIENETFVSAEYAVWTLWIAAGVALLSFLLQLLPDRPKVSGLAAEGGRRSAAWIKRRTVVSVIILGAIVLGAAVLYTRALGNEKLLADEYVSLVAARGILRHGIPIFEHTGIIYTRSSLYHYLLAFVMLISGQQNFVAAKFLSTLWQLATIVLVFVWGRQLKGEKVALAAAALVAFSPFVVYFAREIRFYSQYEFFVTLTFYFLWRATQHPERQWYRVATLLAFSGAYLSQQLAFALLPAMFLVPLFSGQLRLWFRGLSLVAVLFAILVMGLDALAYFVYCQTYLPYVDAETVSLLALHNDVWEVLPSMLLSGYERTGFAVGTAYTAGAIFVIVGLFRSAALRLRATTNGWTWWSFLYLTSLSTMLLTTLVASRPTPRYIVQLVPLVVLAAVCGLDTFASVISRSTSGSRGRFSGSLVRLAFAGGCALLLVSAYRPLRTWNTTSRNDVRDLTDAVDFLKKHALPSDKLIVLSPEAALFMFDRCDYMWRPKKGSVFKYIARDGIMRERNSAAIVMDNDDKLRATMANSDRVWIVAQTQNLAEKGRSPSGELSMFVMNNFKVAYEPIGMTVMVWSRDDGHFRNTITDFGYDKAGF